MKMSSQRRALDKIFKRRDRYEIPDWQREKVWDAHKKQQLIDTILRGWRLPKFYFVKTGDDEYEVVDGQQRLSAIFEFFSNELHLSPSSTALFGGPTYKELKPKFSDAFDDFEIDYDEIESATEEEQKQFFQRLQEGLPLTSSEKLNSVHSKLRDFCKTTAKHDFFKKSVVIPNTRYAHFDVVSKAVAIEIEGIGAGLRYDDIKPIFEQQANFSGASAVAKRIKAAMDLLAAAFPEAEASLKNRTVVQSVITMACRVVATGKSKNLEKPFANFIRKFAKELSHQVELGQASTDYDFIRFQRSVNANVKAGARTRQEILLRKAFMFEPTLAGAFDAAMLKESGISLRVKELGEAITGQIGKLNDEYSAKHGEDLFKATNKTAGALTRIGKPITDFESYKKLIEDLYFLFRESVGQRLAGVIPDSFHDVNTLRTDLQHDIDHGEKKKVKAKKLKIGQTFLKYSGAASPGSLEQDRFVLVQANILSALELDLRTLLLS